MITITIEGAGEGKGYNVFVNGNYLALSKRKIECLYEIERKLSRMSWVDEAKPEKKRRD